MATFRSWFGSFFSLLVFFFVRHFTAGLALPLFATLSFSFIFIWRLVLRVPERLKSDDDDDDDCPVSATSPTGVADKPTPSQATVPEVKSQHRKNRKAHASRTDQTQPLDTEKPISNVSAQLGSGESRGELCEKGEEGPPASTTERTMECVAPQTEVHKVDEGVGKGVGGSEVELPAQMDGSDNEVESGEEQNDEEAEQEEHVDPVRAQELRLQGNEFFKEGKLYDAREAYSEALYISPPDDAVNRALLFGNRAAVYQKLERWEETITDSRSAIELDPNYLKAYRRRSAAAEKLGRWHDAFEDLKKIVELDPDCRSKESGRLAFLERRAQEQFEKDKDEMVSKLKDLGNTVLGKFGMSMDNFKCEKDPDTGSYSVKFQS